MYFRRHKKKNRFKIDALEVIDEFLGRYTPDDITLPLSRKQLKKLKKAEKTKLSEKQREAAVYELKVRKRILVTVHKNFK